MYECTQLKLADSEIKQLKAENARLLNIIGQFCAKTNTTYLCELSQVQRLLAACARQYGKDDVLTLKLKTMGDVPLGSHVHWGCTGRSEDDIIIKGIPND